MTHQLGVYVPLRALFLVSNVVGLEFGFKLLTKLYLLKNNVIWMRKA